MSRVDLPDGVPADNEPRRSYASKEPPRHDVPDMATPNFSKPVFVETDSAKDKAYSRSMSHSQTVESSEEPIRLLPKVNMNLLFIGLAAVLIAALAAAFLLNGPKRTPLCADQPEWNQYNCRAG